MPPKTRQTKQGSGDAGTEKRKPVRRDPEKRRQQNVQAQRKYREKLRERLTRLEALAATAAQSRDIQVPSPTGTGAAESSPKHGSSITSPKTISSKSPIQDGLDGSISASSVPTPGAYQQLIPQIDDIPSILNTWDTIENISQLGTAPSTLQPWDNPIINVDPSLLIRDKQNNNTNTNHAPYFTTTVECGCSSPHFHIRTQGPRPFSSGNFTVFKFAQPAPIPDPYMNNLRIEAVCTTSAFFNLSLHIGISENVLCADESLSPFFQPCTQSDGDLIKGSTVSEVQNLFKALKPDLRPNNEQITIRHHPYIDILPFPTLRKNLILCQQDVDEDEFFLDMLTGLVCWGGAGIGKRDRDLSTGYASTGTPWDVRSWEAKAWFLKKYWGLLGGDEGELVRQSDWWRGLRGDESLDTALYSEGLSQSC